MLNGRDEDEIGTAGSQWLFATSPAVVEEQRSDKAVLDYLTGGNRFGTAPESWVKALLPRERKATRPDWLSARSWAQNWWSLGLSLQEVESWLAVGVSGSEDHLVDELVGEGIDPQRSTSLCSHPETSLPSSILEVAREFLRSPYLPLAQALDAAGVERTPGLRPSQLVDRQGFLLGRPS